MPEQVADFMLTARHNAQCSLTELRRWRPLAENLSTMTVRYVGVSLSDGKVRANPMGVLVLYF